MPLDLIQQSFNAGEWSPLLDGRSDLEKYYSACRLLENTIPTRYGPAERRPGLYYVAEVKDSSKATRLLPFKHSTVQAYMLEFGDQYIRFFKDRGQIIDGVGTEDISALDNQVAHWLLNETAGTAVDDAVASVPHDGTASVDADTLTATGKVGTGCFDLDGQYNVTVASHAALSFDDSGSNPFSIACWGYITQQNDIQVLLSKWDETTGSVKNEWRFSLTNDRKLQLHLADTSANLSSDVVSQWKLNDDAANAYVIASLPQYAITAVNTTTETFTFQPSSDIRASFPDGSEFTVEGSTGNDSQWVVSSTAWSSPNLTITVTGNITDATADGTVAPHAGVCTVNTDTINATGKINGALNLGGSKAVEIDDSADFTFDDSGTAPFSIAAWVYVVPYTADQVILSKYDDTTGAKAREWILYINSSENLSLQLSDESENHGAMVISNSVLTSGWHFIVSTYDGSGGSSAADGITLYVDGVALTDVTTTTDANYVAMENTATKVVIGANIAIGGSLGNYWQDKIDNVALFSKELTLANILVLYNSGNGTETMGTGEISAVADDAISTGWHFLAATYDSTGGATAAGGIILYVDGVAVGSTNTNDATYTAMQAGASLVRIGAQESTGGVAEKFWGDKMDEISLFSDVLTATEMAALYSTTPYEISSPYLEADLFGLQRIQSADVMYGFHSSYNPRKLKRFEHVLWELENTVFDWPPFMTENITDTTITPSGTVGTVNLTATSPIFTSDHIGSHWLIKHNRTDNNITKQLTAIATLVVLGDAPPDSYAAAGVTDILVDVKGAYRFRTDSTTGSIWIGTLVLERSYNGILTLVIDTQPQSGNWAAGDIITGATSGDTCIIVSRIAGTAIEGTHYTIKQLSGSFTDAEILSNQSGNVWNDATATYPRYEGWHILETVQSAGNQDFNIAGNEELGDAYLRVRRTVDNAGNDPTVTLTCERFYNYGIVKVTGFSSATSVTAVTIRTLKLNATKLWSEGAWSTERGYPGTGTFHEERLLLGGTTFEPHRLDGSKTDDWENFRADSVLDNDSISYSLAASEMNAIRWLISKEVLLMGTAGAEWSLGSLDVGEPLTPGNPTVPRVQTTYGSKNIRAILLANTVLFVVGGQSAGAKGRVVRGVQFVFEKGESGGYDAADYTILAEHITKSGIVSMAYQQQPEPILWCVLDNGHLIGMTFEPGQKVWGWFRVVTDGDFEDVAVIPGVDEDEIWCIVNRTINGSTKRYVEYFKPRKWGDDQKDCFFVDSGLTFSGGAAVTITGITKANPAVVTMDTYPTDGDGDNIADGDQVRIRYVGGMPEVNNRIFTVSNPNVSNKTFELRDKLDAVDINSTDFAALVASITGDTTYDSKDITNVSAAGIAALALGAPITGTGISDDTTIVAIDDDFFTMSAKATVTGTAVTVTIGGTVEQVDNVFSGLDHLEAKTVSVLGDGTVHEDVVVTSGSVTLTDYFNKVHIGLRYISKLMPMKLEAQTRSGTARAKIKRIHDIIFSFYESLGCTFGTTEGTETIPFRKTTDAMGEAVPLFTGEKQQTFPGGYELLGDIFVEQKQPLPLTVRSITPRLQLYD